MITRTQTGVGLIAGMFLVLSPTSVGAGGGTGGGVAPPFMIAVEGPQSPQITDQTSQLGSLETRQCFIIE